MKRNSKQFLAVYQVEYILSHFTWYFINAAIFLAAAWHSPSEVMTHYPRRVMYAFGFQFILMALRTQLSGVTQERYNPFRRTSIITWVVLISHILSVRLTGDTFMNEALMYLGLDILSFGSLAHFIVCVTIELTTILDINLLTLTKKQISNQVDLARKQREAAAEAFKQALKDKKE